MSKPAANDWQEEEANFFAMCLLLPREPFLESYRELLENPATKYDVPKHLAERFEVEEYLVGKRLQYLNL